MPTMKAQQGQNDIEEPPPVDSDFPTGDESKVVASDSVPDWDSIPKPTGSLTSKGSIRKSALGAKSQEIFDKIKTRNNQSQITIEDAFETYTQSEEKDLRIKKLKYALCGMFIMVILCAAAAFSSTFAAVNLSKESHISGGAMVGIDPATNNKAIVQVAQATDSKLNLFHSLVLDEAHLRTMDEIVYSYYPEGSGTKATRTDKVFRVERRVGKDPSEVNVTITLYGNTKVVIAPKEEGENKLRLFTDGGTYPLCGQMRCANFIVDDADLDLNVLNRKVDVIMGVTDGDSRRLEQPTCQRADDSGRRLGLWEDLLDSINTNYGCCSTNLKFLLGGEDSAACNKPNYEDIDVKKRYQNLDGGGSTPKNGDKISRACHGHDTCLYNTCADKGCECWGNCDKKLAADMRDKGGLGDCGPDNDEWYWFFCGCKNWYKKCTAARKAIEFAMSRGPNAC